MFISNIAIMKLTSELISFTDYKNSATEINRFEEDSSAGAEGSDLAQ